MPRPGPQSRRQPGLEQSRSCGRARSSPRSRRRSPMPAAGRSTSSSRRSRSPARRCMSRWRGSRRPSARSGLSGPIVFAGDLLAMFSSVTLATEGYCVVAGTGAGAIRIRGGEIDRVVDLAGWQLGDLGSGYWLGHEAAEGRRRRHGGPRRADGADAGAARRPRTSPRRRGRHAGPPDAAAAVHRRHLRAAADRAGALCPAGHRASRRSRRRRA